MPKRTGVMSGLEALITYGPEALMCAEPAKITTRTFVSKTQRDLARKELEPDVKACGEEIYNDLKQWIKSNIIPIKTIDKNGSSSYGLKHFYKKEYVNNNVFKAAMIDCDFWYPADELHLATKLDGNLHFNISKKSKIFKKEV